MPSVHEDGHGVNGLGANRALAVENELNNRPRLVLNDRAPAELVGPLLASKNRPRCDVDWNPPCRSVVSIQLPSTDGHACHGLDYLER